MNLDEVLQERERGKSLSEPLNNQDQNLEQKMKNVQYQNDLLMERMNQLNEEMEKILTTSNGLHNKFGKEMQNQLNQNEEKIKNGILNLNDKVIRLQTANETLSDNFQQAITNEVDSVMQDIQKLSTDYAENAEQKRENQLEEFSKQMNTFFDDLGHRVDEIYNQFNKQIEQMNKKTEAAMEKQQKNIRYFDNLKFGFTVIIMVAITVVLVRALFFGIWEGLYVNQLYEWGSQWDWLKYTLWSLFALIIGGTGWFAYKFINKNMK